MRIEQTTRFNKHLARLPVSVQDQFAKQIALLADNPRHPSLHFKKLVDKDDTYSIRIASNYRAIFMMAHDTCIFFAIGHRKDVYR